jgi:hypothetical protein
MEKYNNLEKIVVSNLKNKLILSGVFAGCFVATEIARRILNDDSQINLIHLVEMISEFASIKYPLNAIVKPYLDYLKEFNKY